MGSCKQGRKQKLWGLEPGRFQVQGYLGSRCLAKPEGDADCLGEATLSEAQRMIRPEPETQVKCEVTAELNSSSCKQPPTSPLFEKDSYWTWEEWGDKTGTGNKAGGRESFGRKPEWILGIHSI